jgi:hypothetical protein
VTVSTDKARSITHQPVEGRSVIAFMVMDNYTQAEKLVLLAGMAGGRDSVWSQLPGAVQSLGNRGLVEMARKERDDGTIDSVPLRLSELGAEEARRIQEER